MKFLDFCLWNFWKACVVNLCFISVHNGSCPLRTRSYCKCSSRDRHLSCQGDGQACRQTPGTNTPFPGRPSDGPYHCFSTLTGSCLHLLRYTAFPHLHLHIITEASVFFWHVCTHMCERVSGGMRGRYQVHTSANVPCNPSPSRGRPPGLIHQSLGLFLIPAPQPSVVLGSVLLKFWGWANQSSWSADLCMAGLIRIFKRPVSPHLSRRAGLLLITMLRLWLEAPGGGRTRPALRLGQPAISAAVLQLFSSYMFTVL